ncbi:hypothetical protein MHYP_G00102930 [Metynnis hypsauchen]
MLKVAKEECLIWKLAELRSCAPEPPMVSELDLGMTMGPDTIEPHTTTPKDPEAYSSTLMSIQSLSLHAQTDRSESTLGEPKASACTWTSPQSHSSPALADRRWPVVLLKQRYTTTSMKKMMFNASAFITHVKTFHVEMSGLSNGQFERILLQFKKLQED